MITSSIDTDMRKRHKAGVLPPWLWFWLVLYLIDLPKRMVALWQRSLQPIIFPQPLPGSMGGSAIASIQALPAIAEMLPAIMLLAGVVFLLFPKLRQKRIEERYKLETISTQSPILRDIVSTVEEYASGVQVKTNLLRTDQLAFSYPTGYRSSAIAVFGGLVKLWRSDKEAGKAVLLHELAHCRHGDVLMIGTGSFFETILNYWLKFLVIFFMVPTAFLFVWFLAGSLHEHWQLAQMMGELDSELGAINRELAELGIEPAEAASRGNWLVEWLLFQGKMLLSLGIPATVTSVLVLLLQTPIIILTALMATWCAEFNADRFVVEEQSTQQPLLKSLKVVSPSMSKWAWLTSRLSHPPVHLRQWMVTKGLAPRHLVLLLLLFPATFLAKLCFINMQVIAVTLPMYPLNEMWQLLIEGNGYGLRSIGQVFLGIGVALLLYPRLASRWESFFCKADLSIKPPAYQEYALTAGIMVAFGLLIYSVGSSLIV